MALVQSAISVPGVLGILTSSPLSGLKRTIRTGRLVHWRNVFVDSAKISSHDLAYIPTP
jgi:hypothetical protein